MAGANSKLQNKLLLLAMLPAAMITIVLTTFTANQRIEDIEQLTADKANAIAQQIAADNVNTLFTRNRNQIQAKMDNYLATYRDLAAISISSNDEEFNYTQFAEQIPAIDLVTATSPINMRMVLGPLDDYEIDDYETQEAPVARPVNTIGKVEIRLIDRTSRQKNEIILTSLLILIVTLGVTILVVFPMSRRLTNPIQKLVSAFHQLGLGDYQVRVKVDSNDELRNLQQGFNDMSIALSSQHDDLNEQVEQVTGDLQTTLQAIEIQNVELDIARKQALESSRVKSEFLANMSHEIRTPMNGIVGFTELLQKTSLTALQQQYLESIGFSAKNLLQILNDILDFSKLEAGHIEIRKQPFQVENCIEEVVTIFTPQAHEKGLNLVPMLFSDVPDWVIGDRLRITQVLSNLLSNAIKFTEQGDVILRVMLDDIDDQHAELSFSVTDTGIGIPADKQGLLFKPFRQINSNMSRGFGGTGLGLSISKSLVDMMGGQLTLQSEPAKGSVFQFSLNLKYPAASDNEPSSQNPAFINQSVLLLDNHLQSRKAISNQLELLGLSVDAPTNYTLDSLVDQIKTEHRMIILSPSNRELADMELLQRSMLPEQPPCLLLIGSSDQQRFERINQRCNCALAKKPVFRNALAGQLEKLILQDMDKPAGAAIEAPEAGKLAGRKILVVDDNDINRGLMVAMLKGSSATVEQAENGRQALSRLEQQDYDLVLMDIHMPEINGIEALSRLRNSGNNVPVIALTADVAFHESSDMHAQRQGFNGILLKPIESSALFRAIDTQLNGPQDDAKMHAVPEVADSSADADANLPIRDLQQALRISGGQAGVANKLLNQLVSQLPGYLEKIDHELAQTNWQELWQVLHKLHGATSVCGVPALNAAVNTMQRQVRNADYLALSEALIQLHAEARRLIEFSEHEIDQDSLAN